MSQLGKNGAQEMSIAILLVLSRALGGGSLQFIGAFLVPQ